MTREEVKEVVPVLQAFAEGKKIEYFSESDKKWHETETITNLLKFYRIKK